MAADQRSGVEPCKIFVGGLSWSTNEASLGQYFGQYGEVTQTVIMTDDNNKPRGFGFVTFSSQDAVKKVIESQHGHYLDGKKIDPKYATQKTGKGQQQPTHKVFVGGVPAGTTEEELSTHFQEFGKVKSVDMKFDNNTQRMRGFVFVEFEEMDVAKRVIQIHFHNFKGKLIEVKMAQPRSSSSENNQQQQPVQSYDTDTTKVSMGYPQAQYTQQQYANYYSSQQSQQQPTYYGAYPQGFYPGNSGYNQTERSYGGGGQQVTASVPGQQMSSFQSAHSYGGGGSRAAPSYSNGSDGYSTASYSYQDSRTPAAQAAAAAYPQYDQSAATNNYSRMGAHRSAGYDYAS